MAQVISETPIGVMDRWAGGIVAWCQRHEGGHHESCHLCAKVDRPAPGHEGAEVGEALGNFRQGNIGDLEVSPLHLFKLIRKTRSSLKVTFLIPRRGPVYPMSSRRWQRCCSDRCRAAGSRRRETARLRALLERVLPDDPGRAE